jgi:dihydrofolate synthase / folylpolyglutamate synthase
MTDYTAVQRYLYGLKYRGALYGVDRMSRFSAALDHPERRYPVVHVAGTNGKGSTCAMLEAIFRAAGYRTGLFTSPHLVHQGERVQVNRAILDRAAICHYTRTLQPVAEAQEAACPDSHPTFFEFMTAMAFLRFAEAQVDVAVIETGLGGRLDATNVVQPCLCIITSISLDHTEILGDSIEAIAAEKAGILKPGIPVVLGHMPSAAEAVITARAEALGCAVHRIADHFGTDREPWPRCALAGDYQRYNAAMATLASRLLRHRFALPDAAIACGLDSVVWAGRWDRHPATDRSIILDASHNPEGASFLDKNLAAFVRDAGYRPVIVTGALGLPRARALLPVVARHAREIVLVRPHQPRACSLQELQEAIPTTFVGSVRAAQLRDVFPAPSIITIGQPGETVIATGSIYLIGEILEALTCDQPTGGSLLQD